MEESLRIYWTSVQQKLNQEISTNDKQMFFGIFIVVLIIAGGYLLTLSHPETRLAVTQFTLIVLMSGFWWVARQELMMHNPGTYLKKVSQWMAQHEQSRTEISLEQFQTDIGDWETYKDALWFRKVLLTTSDLMAPMFVFFVIWRLYMPYDANAEILNWWIARLTYCGGAVGFLAIFGGIHLSDR